MKKYAKITEILICLAVLCFAGGFFIWTISTNTIFIAISVMVIGAIFALSAIYPAAKMIQHQNNQKEDRIRKLEEEIAELKKSDPR